MKIGGPVPITQSLGARLPNPQPDPSTLFSEPRPELSCGWKREGDSLSLHS